MAKFIAGLDNNMSVKGSILTESKVLIVWDIFRVWRLSTQSSHLTTILATSYRSVYTILGEVEENFSSGITVVEVLGDDVEVMIEKDVVMVVIVVQESVFIVWC